MSSHELRWLIYPLCGVLGTRRKQLGQHHQQYQQDGDQCTGTGLGAWGRAGRVLQHAHHPGPGPVVGQGGDACHLAHEVVDIHDSDGSGSEVWFEICKGKARKQVVKASPGLGRAERGESRGGGITLCISAALGLVDPPCPQSLAKGLWTWKAIWKVLGCERKSLSMVYGDVSIC